METWIDRSTDQTESTRGANNPFKRTPHVPLAEDLGVTPMTRMESFNRNSESGPDEAILLEVGEDIDPMKVVDYIKQRVAVVVEVEADRIYLKAKDPTQRGRLEKELRKLAEGESGFTRIDNIRNAA